jgi:hypothetical protein
VAHGFGLVPVEAEMASGDRQIRGHGQFLVAAREHEGAVVADAQAKAALPAAAGGVGCPLANLAQQGEFASSVSGSRMGLFHLHVLRIGQAGGILPGRPRGGVILRRFRIHRQ